MSNVAPERIAPFSAVSKIGTVDLLLARGLAEALDGANVRGCPACRASSSCSSLQASASASAAA